VSFSSVLRGPRILGSEVRAGLSGDESTRERAAVALYGSFIVVVGGLAWGLGVLAYRVQSARVATLVAVAAAIVGALGCAPLVPQLLRKKRATDGAAAPDASSAPREPSFIAERVVCAVLFAAIEDGLVATSTTLRAQTGTLPAILTGLESTCLLLLPLGLLLLPAGFVLSRPGAEGLGRHLRAGLGGGRPEAGGLAAALYAALVAIGASLSWGLGLKIAEARPAEVAVVASMASAVLSTLLAAFVVAAASPLLAWIAGRASRLAKIPAWLPLEELVLAAIGILTLYALLPPTQAITPAAGVVGFALGPHIALRLPSVRSLAHFPALALLAAALVVTVASGWGFDRLPDLVRTGVIGRAPYAAILVSALRRPFDRDHDGYSQILAGGLQRQRSQRSPGGARDSGQRDRRELFRRRRALVQAAAAAGEA
jgi:hypothetical protein